MIPNGFIYIRLVVVVSNGSNYYLPGYARLYVRMCVITMRDIDVEGCTREAKGEMRYEIEPTWFRHPHPIYVVSSLNVMISTLQYKGGVTLYLVLHGVMRLNLKKFAFDYRPRHPKVVKFTNFEKQNLRRLDEILYGLFFSSLNSVFYRLLRARSLAPNMFYCRPQSAIRWRQATAYRIWNRFLVYK